MSCRDCQYFVQSNKANAPRPGLAGWGYCSVGKDFQARAQFFHESRQCWQLPAQFKERADGPADQ